MKQHDWIGKPDQEKADEESEPETEVQAEEDEEESKAEASTVSDLVGEAFDPLEKLAVLVLVDIAPEVKRLRQVPQLFHIRRPVTTIGTGRRAHVKVDDLKTVKTEHGAIVFRNGEFRIYPQGGAVSLNGREVSEDGESLINGSQIEIGSARFVLLTILESLDEDVTLLQET
jgi:hypothetical protein